MFALIIPLTGDGAQLPDHSLPPGWSGRPPGRPDRPDNSLPEGRPDHIWGGVGGGGRPDRPGHDLPTRPGHIDNTLPEGPQPKTSLHQAVPESSIPSHPELPDTTKPGAWLLVALGDNQVGWAWAETPPPEAQPK